MVTLRTIEEAAWLSKKVDVRRQLKFGGSDSYNSAVLGSWKRRRSTAEEPGRNIARVSDDKPAAIQEVNEALPNEPEHQPERDQSWDR